MPEKTVPVDTCSKLVESATRSCQPLISVPPEAANPNWDAMAASFASLSNAFAWGSLILTLAAIFAAFTWGKIVTARAEKEAREMAELAVKKWLKDAAPPLIAREAVEFLRTFRGESTISVGEVANMVAAAGADEKEVDNGKK